MKGDEWMSSFDDEFPSLKNRDVRMDRYGLGNANVQFSPILIMYHKEAIEKLCLDKQKVRKDIETCLPDGVFKSNLLFMLGLKGDWSMAGIDKYIEILKVKKAIEKNRKHLKKDQQWVMTEILLELGI